MIIRILVAALAATVVVCTMIVLVVPFAANAEQWLPSDADRELMERKLAEYPFCSEECRRWIVSAATKKDHFAPSSSVW